MSDKPVESRLQTAADPAKAFRQYDELRRTKRLKRAVIVAELENGSFRVLGQTAIPLEVAQLLWVGVNAVCAVPEHQRGSWEGEAIVVDDTPLPPHPARPVRTAGRPVHSIAGAWSAFETAVLGADVGAIQRREMRRAFYAGARELFNTMPVMLDPGEEETEDDMTRMSELNAELERFVTDLGEGRAWCAPAQSAASGMTTGGALPIARTSR